MWRVTLCVALLASFALLSAQAARPSPAAGSQEVALYLPLAYGRHQPLLPASVRIAPWCAQFDAPGDDRDNLNEEYICLYNNGDAAGDLTGWRVRDAISTTYTFSAFSLPGKATVRLHTGTGANTATDVYWGRGAPVWNNDGDTVLLYDAFGTLVDRYSY